MTMSQLIIGIIITALSITIITMIIDAKNGKFFVEKEELSEKDKMYKTIRILITLIIIGIIIKFIIKMGIIGMILK